ncbi:hypothetical protein VST7929_02838 [Vibrio stylophorae]|uniref:DUF3131 domain-containing protein n=1 Tax=Vibrio stylophorae TaxID=659351 RepID=A0ABN8DV38_9VIBR|nr:DUF3131 domain-containing protein [Vibrio stylophorae]CAH0535177.1 hypothetical protein VST7929_02838 [Vibrio stylophorae]
MSFKTGLVRARHHLVFIAGLVIALMIVFSIEAKLSENELERPVVGQQLTIDQEDQYQLPLRQKRALSKEEYAYAKIAWQYFENNLQPSGLVNSVDGYPSTTLWDSASYLMALIAAERLEIITTVQFNQKMSAALQAISQIDLVDDKLPNKVYHTQRLNMVAYDNSDAPQGIGWSAIDIGRVMVPLHILVWHYPQHTQSVQSVLANWQWDALIDDGYLMGSRRSELGQLELVQEGRIGYEEYAAKSIALLGKDVDNAREYIDYLQFVPIDGVEIPTDKRDPARYRAHNYVVSESYILDMLEYGGDDLSAQFAYRVYLAQQNRYQRTKVVTAVSEDHLDKPPYFVYNTVFSDGQSWHTVTEDGQSLPELRTFSTKAAFGWYALYDTEYSALLFDEAKPLFDEEKGWYAGRYEENGEINRALTANTNGIVLESLAYIATGPMLTIGQP